MKYSVFTVMLKDDPAEVVAEKLEEFGLDGVEWRISEDGKHFSPKDLKARASEVKKISEKHHLEIPILSTYLSLGETAEIQEVVRAAKDIGAPMVRVLAPRFEGELHHRVIYEEAVRHLGKCEDIASIHGVKIVLEIHMGNIIPSASAAFGLLRHFDPDCVGVIFDPGNMVWEGMENWTMGLQILGSYTAHVHVKNSLWARAGEGEEGTTLWKPSMCPLREGIVNWREVISALRKVNYRGYLSLEDFSEVKSPEERIVDDLRYLKSLEGQR